MMLAPIVVAVIVIAVIVTVRGVKFETYTGLDNVKETYISMKNRSAVSQRAIITYGTGFFSRDVAVVKRGAARFTRGCISCCRLMHIHNVE
jgi:hypothetical protein